MLIKYLWKADSTFLIIIWPFHNIQIKAIRFFWVCIIISCHNFCHIIVPGLHAVYNLLIFGMKKNESNKTCVRLIAQLCAVLAMSILTGNSSNHFSSLSEKKEHNSFLKSHHSKFQGAKLRIKTNPWTLDQNDILD